MEYIKKDGLRGSYSVGLNASLGRMLDFFAGSAAVAAGLAALRLGQFGPSYFVMVASFLLLCVVPTLLLRAPRHLKRRGGLVISGFLLAISVGVFNLGVLAVALVGLPVLLGMTAAMFGRRMPYIVLAGSVVALTVAAFLFVGGDLTGPAGSVAAWNTNPTNWLVMIVALAIISVVIITLIQQLQIHWQATHMQAAQSARIFETLVETAPDAILIFDTDTGQYLTANAPAERLFGYARDVLRNNITMQDLLPEHQPSGEDSGAVVQDQIALTLEGQNTLFELQILNVDGVEIPCEVLMSQLPVEGQNLIRANLIDISQRKADQERQRQLQAQLAASQRLEALGKLTGGVAHDFNNLLAVILGNLELLRETSDQGIDPDLLQPCIDAVLRGADLTASLLSFARKAPLIPQVVDINSILMNTRNWAGRTLPSSLRVETKLADHLWPTRLDPAALENAVLNLILNAKEAMPHDGILTIKTRNVTIDQSSADDRGVTLPAGRYAMVAVCDTGGGIEADHLNKVTEPFFTTKPIGAGSGLGLPMVQGFAGQSGGTLQLFSQAGSGTVVKLYFPAVFDEDITAEPPADNDAPIIAQGLRILFAEDDTQVAKVVSNMLRNAGYAVDVAPSGEAAKDLYQADPTYDLLLTDLMMPGRLQGGALADELLAINPELRVIFLSGYASDEFRAAGRIHQDRIWLMKPVPRDKLLKAVAQALQSSS